MTQLVPASHPLASGDPESIGRVGREIIRQVDLDRLAALIERRTSSILLEELANILQALELADPRGSSRRTGIVGRLLGRDVAVQACERQAHDHVRLRLEQAARRAGDVRMHIAELDEAIAHIRRQRTRLAEIADRGREAIGAFAVDAATHPDAMARRLNHIAVLISSWDVAVAHLRLVRQYGDLLLTRFNHLCDVVFPQWQRQIEAEHACAGEGAAEPLRAALTSLLQSTSPEPAVFPRLGDVRV